MDILAVVIGTISIHICVHFHSFLLHSQVGVLFPFPGIPITRGNPISVVIFNEVYKNG